jgi:hypothetical protein
MVDLMRDTGGMVEQINPTKLAAVTGENNLGAAAETASREHAMKPPRPKKPRTKKKK